MNKDKSEDERLKIRTESVNPLVDAYFAWVKDTAQSGVVDMRSKVGKALTYSLNQEKYLRKILEDGIIPLDNNDVLSLY